jgi:hypothetical protein
MSTPSLGSTKLNDQMILERVRRILKEADWKGEAAEKHLGELLVRYLKGEVSFPRAISDLETDFSPD